MGRVTRSASSHKCTSHLGFSLGQFVKAKFELQDIIIKVKHRDRSSEFYARSNKILLSHEYLFILRKPEGA